MTQEPFGTGGKAVRSRAEHRDEASHIGAGPVRLVGEAVERSAETADHTGLFLGV